MTSAAAELAPATVAWAERHLARYPGRGRRPAYLDLAAALASPADLTPWMPIITAPGRCRSRHPHRHQPTR